MADPNFNFTAIDSNLLVAPGQVLAQSFEPTVTGTVGMSGVGFKVSAATAFPFLANLYADSDPANPTSGALLASSEITSDPNLITNATLFVTYGPYATVSPNTSYWLVLTPQNANVVIATNSTAAYRGALLINDANIWSPTSDMNTRVAISVLPPPNCP